MISNSVVKNQELKPIVFQDTQKIEDDMGNELYNILFANSLSFQVEKEKYTPNTNKEGNKRLISRCTFVNKEVRKAIKTGMRNYLCARFIFRGKPLNSQMLFEKSDFYQKRKFSIKNGNNDEFDSYEIITEIIYDEKSSKSIDCERFIIKNGREYINMNAKEKEIFAKDVIISLFNGSRLEIFKYPCVLDGKPLEYWNDWWIKETSQITHYRDIIYPLMSSAVLNVLELLDKQNMTKSPLMIMEIAGGNGELAEIILANAQYPENSHYVFLELNEPSLEEAKIKLQKFSNVEICQTDLVNDKAYGTVLPYSVDLILGSGILTRCVLDNKQDAETILKKVYHYLKSEGYLILAGHAEMLLSANDFKKAGFNVINCTANGGQFYILQKQPPSFERILQKQTDCKQQ